MKKAIYVLILSLFTVHLSTFTMENDHNQHVGKKRKIDNNIDNQATEKASNQDIDHLKAVISEAIVEDKQVEFRCPLAVCQKVMSNNYHFQRHVEAQHYMCGDCKLQYVGLKELALHKKLHNKKLVDFETFKCTVPLCEDLFSKKTELAKHKEEVHFQCNACNEIFNSKQELKEHNETHLKAKILAICTVCKKNFANDTSMKIHREYNHLGCYNCAKECTSFDDLKNHVRENHPKRKVPEYQLSCTHPGCTYKVQDCHKVKALLSRHIAQEHPNEKI